MGTNFYWTDKAPITSAKIADRNPRHARINVFVKSQMCGTLTVDLSDAEAVVRALTERQASEDEHIGKRSAAGLYCWDCRATLCPLGEKYVHFVGGKWLEACPKCGAKPQKEPIEESAAGIELGFNESGRPRRKGVAGCSSFSFAQKPDKVISMVTAGTWVEDEYGRKLSPDDFQQVLEDCPIKFTDSVGKEFS